MCITACSMPYAIISMFKMHIVMVLETEVSTSTLDWLKILHLPPAASTPPSSWTISPLTTLPSTTVLKIGVLVLILPLAV